MRGAANARSYWGEMEGQAWHLSLPVLSNPSQLQARASSVQGSGTGPSYQAPEEGQPHGTRGQRVGCEGV